MDSFESRPLLAMVPDGGLAAVRCTNLFGVQKHRRTCGKSVGV